MWYADRISEFLSQPRHYESDVFGRYPWLEVFDRDELHAREARRVDSDLRPIYQRLVAWEYLLRDFSPQRAINLPARMQEFFVYLHSYKQLGKMRQSIAEIFPLEQIDTIGDLCPWRSPKVPLGLYYAGYAWRIDIIDCSPESHKMIGGFMSLFDAKFTLGANPVHIESDQIGTYQLLMWNHIMDDLLIEWWSKRSNQPDLLQRYYDDEDLVRQVWTEIADWSSGFVEDLTANLADALTSSLLPWWHLALVDYESYLSDVLNSSIVTDTCKHAHQFLDTHLLAAWCTPVPHDISIKDTDIYLYQLPA